MKCPRCSYPDAQEPSCARCGVVFAKLRSQPPRTARPRPTAVPGPAPANPSRIIRAASRIVPLLVAATVWHLNQGPGRVPPPAAPPPSMAPETAANTAGAAIPERAPEPATTSVGDAEVRVATGPAAISAADVERANALTRRVDARQPISAEQLATAEQLRRQYPSESKLTQLVQRLLMAIAGQEQRERRYAEADQRLQRAIVLDPSQLAPRQQLVTLRLAAADWAGAERAARDILAQATDDPAGLKGLGFALFRQDENREAMRALERLLDMQEDPEARAVLARLQKGSEDEAGMTEQQLAYFNVRYDGSEHAGVGRAVLRALERHYATLARTFDHRPPTAIPVILFSRQAYHDASGAPAWSGGVFNSMDGRIRIPIGGLTESLSPNMDGTLVHELTHAFIYYMSRSVAPRNVHEGLAQYMEGKRVERMLSRDHLRLLAQGRASGVSGFYLEALAFVEFLVGQRSMGGMNDLLEAMGETGDVDAAFRKVHGRSHSEMERAWRSHMRRRYGT